MTQISNVCRKTRYELNTGAVPQSALEDVKIIEQNPKSNTAEKNWAELIKAMPFAVKETALKVDKEIVNNIREKWNKRMFGLSDVIDQIIPNLIGYVKNFIARPMIFVGSPGCGKTRSVKTIAEILGMPMHLDNAVQLANGKGIIGNTLCYIGAKPGLVVTGMQEARQANFVLGIDEIDKANMYCRGGEQFQNALLTLTADTTNDRYTDNFLGFSINAKYVLIIMTANNIEDVSEPLKSRCDVIRFPDIDIDGAKNIINSYTIPQAKKKLGVSNKVFVEDEVVNKVVDELWLKNIKDLRSIQSVFQKAINMAYIKNLQTEENVYVQDEDVVKYVALEKAGQERRRIGF